MIDPIARPRFRYVSVDGHRITGPVIREAEPPFATGRRVPQWRPSRDVDWLFGLVMRDGRELPFISEMKV